jgi:hypothetical protein
MFKPEVTSLPIYFKDKSAFKNAPLNAEGKIDAGVQSKIKDFLLERDHDLEEFAPKKLTEEQQSKITEITNFLTGKASSSFSSEKAEAKPTSDDFDFDDNFSSKKAATAKPESMTDDDFFADL